MKNRAKLSLLTLSVLGLVACAPQSTTVPSGSASPTSSSSVSQASSASSSGTSTAAQAHAFTLDQAKTLAFQTAQVAEHQVSNLTTTTELDNGQTVHEIDFEAGGQEYSYTISAQDGRILEQSKEAADPVHTTQRSQEEVVAIALADANLSQNQVTNLTVTQDHDNGRLVYEVDFVHAGYEHSYSITADTGQIQSRERDLAND